MFAWGTFLTYVFITAITPGPNNIMSWGNGMKQGFVRALPFNFGVLFGFLIVMFGCAFACATLSAVMPSIMTPMRVVGTVYLVWLAWSVWRSSNAVNASPKAAGFRTGALLQFVNVKIYFYGLISMQVFVLPVYNGNPWVIGVFAALLAFMGFACTLCWSAFGHAFRSIYARYERAVNAVMAVGLLWCAYSLYQ